MTLSPNRGLGYFDTVFSAVDIETMAQTLKQFALGHSLTEETTQATVLNSFISTLIKTMDYQEFKQMESRLFTFSKEQTPGMEVDGLNLSKDEWRYLQENIDRLLAEKSEDIKKAPDRGQEPVNTVGEQLNRNSSFLETEVSRTAPQPVVNQSQPDFPSNVPLHFSINQSQRSSTDPRKGSHYATDQDIRYLNNQSNTIQESALWFNRELADSKITYIYQDGGELKNLQVTIQKEHWMHLTGMKPVYNGWVDSLSKTFIDDMATGNGELPNLLLSRGFKDKIRSLGQLPEIFTSRSLVLEQVSSIEKMQRLGVDFLLRTEDESVVLGFRVSQNRNANVPVTLLRPNRQLNTQLTELHQDYPILGVFLERNSEMKILSLNETQVQDEGRMLLQYLQAKTEALSKGETIMKDLPDYSARNGITPERHYRAELERDSDGDGISDLEEKNMGTNPLSPDTDGDGKSDSQEIGNGTNPLDINHPDGFQHSALTQTVSDFQQAGDSSGLTHVLKSGINQYFDSSVYKDYMEFVGKFPRYSQENIDRIQVQIPDASYVTTMKQWEKDFGRTVNAGEKPIMIEVPFKSIKTNPETGEVMRDTNGKPITQVEYRQVPVFDVSQTSGRAIPKPVYELEGTYEDYTRLFKATKEVSEAKGVPVSFSHDTGGANGYYSPREDKIVLKAGLSEQQTLKTLFHEMAHSDLHSLDRIFSDPTLDLSRSTKELQAESVAFVVASHYGLDTSDYTFGYLASWSRDKQGLTDLERQITIVQKEAKSLIGRIDDTLKKYQDKSLLKSPLQEKIAGLKAKVKEKIQGSKEKERIQLDSSQKVSEVNNLKKPDLSR